MRVVITKFVGDDYAFSKQRHDDEKKNLAWAGTHPGNMILGGIDYSNRTLIHNVMRNLRRHSRAHPQRWIAAMHTFAVGSTVAHALCAEFGLDPDEELRP